MELHMPWEKQKHTLKTVQTFSSNFHHQKVRMAPIRQDLSVHTQMRITWRNQCTQSLPGKGWFQADSQGGCFQESLMENTTEERKAHCEAQWSSSNVCLYDIFFVLPLAKKLRRDIIFLPLRTLLNCCYSSSCLGFYLRLFGCIFLGGKNHRSFSAVVGRITEVQTQTMMRKILEFSWFSNTCRLKLRKMQGDGGSCTLYIYIYICSWHRI